MSLKARIRTQFPAVVAATSPLTLTKVGAAYTFGFDVTALPASLDAYYLPINFTQTGTGAAALPYESIFRRKVYTPEMFGASPSPLGTAAASVADSTSALQACINALAAIGGGTMQLGPGVYGITALTISTNNIFIKGAGTNATTILHIVASPSSCLYFSAGAAVLSNTGVSDLSIGSNNTTFNKIAINISDISVWECKNVSVAHYPVDGTTYRGTGTVGTALVIQGREHGHVENFQAYANIPIEISVNPNSATISLDSWTFHNVLLYTNVTTANLITIDPNVVLYNTEFTGAQNWIGGKDGLHWVDAASTIESDGLHISGVKSEQANDATGYIVNIQHNTGLKGFKFADSIGGDRRGLYLRKVVHGTVSNYVHQQSTFETYNIDATAITFKVDHCFWWVGSTATVSGLGVGVQHAFASDGSTTVPSDAFYTTSTGPRLGQGYLANSPSAGLGYGTGAGGTVTQATSKATGVTLNKTTGLITLNNAALASGASVSFLLTNSSIAATDMVLATLNSAYATVATYRVFAEAVGAGQCWITLTNISGGSLSEALKIRFAVLKSVDA